MSVKSKRIVVRPKRFTYVDEDSRNSSAEQSYSSSEDEIDEMIEQPKVRKGITIRNLMKNSENYEKGEDHMYSKNGTPEGTISVSRRGIRNRSNSTNNRAASRNLKRKIDLDDFDESELSQSGKRQKCSSKNAIMARLNRERKKQYISSLETENANLLEENNMIKDKMAKQDKIITNLKRDVVYLKSFLANSKEICQILQNLSKSTGLPVTSSFLGIPVAGEKPATKLSPEHGYVSGSESEFIPLPVPSLNNEAAIVKSVNFNLPIEKEDVNLGNFSLSNNEEMGPLSPYIDDMESPLFPFERDEFLNDAMNPSNFDFKLPNEDVFLDSFLDFNLDSTSEGSTDKILVKNDIPSVGICLHVNRKKISVELCSLCSSKASASMTE